jgi:hypothetical protein
VTQGDFVVYVHDPWCYGNLIVCDFTGDGRIVAQDCAGETYVFDAHELELEEVWAQGQAAGMVAAWKEAA